MELDTEIYQQYIDLQIAAIKHMGLKHEGPTLGEHYHPHGGGDRKPGKPSKPASSSKPKPKPQGPDLSAERFQQENDYMLQSEYDSMSAIISMGGTDQISEEDARAALDLIEEEMARRQGGGEQIQTESATAEGAMSLEEYDTLWDEFRETLTSEEADFLDSYAASDTAAGEINGPLREGKKPPEAVKIMDSLIGKLTLKEPMVVFRGTAQNIKPNSQFTDKGFPGVSTDEGVAGNFADMLEGSLMRITLPAGTRATFGNQAESEIILERGGTFKVRGFVGDIEKEDGQTFYNGYWDVEFVPPKKKK